MKRIDDKTYYTIEELVEIIRQEKYQCENPFPVLKNINSVSGLRDIFRRYGAPKSIRIGTANYYEYNFEEAEGDLYDWFLMITDKSLARENAKVAKATGRNAGNFISLDDVVKKKVSKVTFYNYYNKSENPPQKFKVGSRTYFLYNEVKEWAKQFPALRAEKI